MAVDSICIPEFSNGKHLFVDQFHQCLPVLADAVPLRLLTVASPKEKSPYRGKPRGEVTFWTLGV